MTDKKLTKQQLLDRLKKLPPSALGALGAKDDETKKLATGKALRAIASRAEVFSRPLIGKVYNFHYDAKTKDTLPYWDANPVNIPMTYYKDGFLGMNFHYLDPYNRAILLDRIIDIFEHDITDRGRLTLTYQLLKGVSGLRAFRPCVKRYLWSHVRTKFLEVKRQDWFSIVILPIAKFQKAPEAKVWADSRKMMK